MGKLSRYKLIIPATFLLGLMLTIVLDKPAPVCATCGSTMHVVRSKHTDRQTSDTVSGVTTNTEEITQISVVIGDKGDVFTENSSYKKNSDASSEDHENLHAEDPEGCYEKGEPWKGDYSSGDTTDAKGNRKWHQEDFSEKDGKCMKSVRDREWNAKGKLIKDTGWVKTEVPCVRYSLEVRWEGNYTPPNGYVTVTYGPNTAVVPLEKKGDTYTGKYKGEFAAIATGVCNATGKIPVDFDITAKEVKFGGDTEKLEFTVIRSHTFSWATICPGLSGGSTSPTVTKTDTFTLHPENGASQTFTSLGPNWTYTLKVR